ncbi:aminotransferase class I/II-fold pyridoxal phosphate-dependent enzyme [bacterium]|nr:aminotransferase class I/II-fold pyridoxal phosphate-dependent enzyme [bacterium]
MPKLNPQAEEINQTLKKDNPVIYRLLSDRGRGFYFPKLGIIKQSADAKGKRIDATIGIATEDDGSPLRLESISGKIGLDPKHVFPYASSYGLLELRKTWQELILRKNPSLKERISLPVVTQALTHGLSVAGSLFLNPGDRILIPDKFWGNYRLIFENMYGAALIPFNTFKNGGFDVEALQAALSKEKGKIVLLMNFPNNPAGYTPTDKEASAIVQAITESAASGKDILAVMDDAYFGLVYEKGIFRESLFALLAGAHENITAVKADAATKEEYVWGLRVGFLTFSSKGITEQSCAALQEKTAGIVRGSISNASHLSQSLILQALSSPSYANEKAAKFDLLRKRYEKVKSIFREHGGRYSKYFSPLPYNSGYFMCVELAENRNAEDVRQILLKNYDTGVISQGSLLRVAFSATPTDLLPEVFENIFKACGELG